MTIYNVQTYILHVHLIEFTRQTQYNEKSTFFVIFFCSCYCYCSIRKEMK